MLEVVLDKRLDMQGFALYIRDRDFNSREMMYASNILMDEVPAGIIPPEVGILTFEAVQKLMNDLWNAGMRPDSALIEPRNVDHLEKEIDWLRGTFTAMLAKTLYPVLENDKSTSI